MDSTTALEISMLGETASLDSDSWLSKQSNLKVAFHLIILWRF